MTKQPTYYYDLSGFLNRLTNEGFHIGVDTHILIQKIIGELPMDYDPDELKSLLMPILCKSPKQQMTFQVIFRQFIHQKDTVKTIIDNKTTPEIPKTKPPFWERLLNTDIPLFQKVMTFLQSVWEKITSGNRQKQVAKQTHDVKPEQGEKICADLVPINLSDRFTQSVSRLRLREPLGIQHLDIKNTVRESINNLGFFTPKYKDYTKYTEYLLLIQADNVDDHNARLYNTLYEELEYRNIPAKRYYFRTSPRFCYNEHEKEVSLTTVLHDNAHCVLLIFADLNTFISWKSNELYKWVNAFTELPQRYLLLPFGTAMEAVLAKPLRGVFDAVLPATEFGFEQLENYINQGENKDNFTRYIRLRQAVPTFPIRIETEEELGHLEKLLPNKILLKWIAACAVYPDFSWKMTLFLGELLSDKKTTYNTWDNLRQLARLSWYKEAYMPQTIRRVILEQTNAQTLQWMTLEDMQHISKGIRQLRVINKRQGFVCNEANLITELYPTPKTRAETAAMKSTVDYVTATLVNSNLKDMLFFDLEETARADNHTITKEENTTTISESDAYQKALKENTQAALEQFLQQFPDGTHAQEARQKVSAFTVAKSTEEQGAIFEKVEKEYYRLVESQYTQDIQQPLGQLLDMAENNLKALERITVEEHLKENYQNLIQEIKQLQQELFPVTTTTPEIPETVFIKGGTFLMGSPESEAERQKRELQHEVRLDDFYMTKYPITQKQWIGVMGDNPSSFKENENNPVEEVSWDDAQEFIKKLNEITGDNYRLPTEAEWEYACRAGTTTPFNTGENLTTEQANYNGNYPYRNFPKGKYIEKTTKVGSYPPNSLGLYDMHGNVWEWCEDWYGEKYYEECKKQGIVENPAGPKIGNFRVVRGGSWPNRAVSCRSAYRGNSTPDDRSIDIGFRLVFRPAVS